MSTFDPSLVEKYLKNECSKEEAKTVVAWFKTREGQAYLRLNLDKHLELADDAGYLMLDHEIPSEEMFQRISDLKIRKGYRVRAIALSNWFKAAGSAAAIVFLAAIYIFLFNQDTKKLVDIGTPFGETKAVELPDGSTVTINANSRLSYAANWQTEGDREVWLDGEAFFSVTHTADNQRFIVHTNQIDVEVLGTEFNVKNRRSKTEIMLASGKVKLTANIKENVQEPATRSHDDSPGSETGTARTMIMNPGELVEFSEETKGFKTKIVSPEKYAAWVDNEWVFDQSSLREAIQILEDYYGYEITLTAPAMKDAIFTARVASHDVDVLLEIIAESFELKVSKKQNVITLSN